MISTAQKAKMERYKFLDSVWTTADHKSRIADKNFAPLDWSAEQKAEAKNTHREIAAAIGAEYVHGCTGDMLTFKVPHRSIRALRAAGLLLDCKELEGGRSVFDWRPLCHRLDQLLGPAGAMPAIKTPSPSTPTKAEPLTAEQILARYHELQDTEGQNAANSWYEKNRALLVPERHQAKAMEE